MSLAAAFSKKVPGTAAVAPVAAVPIRTPATAAAEASEAAAGKKRKRSDENAPFKGSRDGGDKGAKVARAGDSTDAADAKQKQSRSEKAKKRDAPKDTRERLERTVFVGNIPLTTTAKSLGRFVQEAINAVKGGAAGGAAETATATEETVEPEVAGKSAGKPNKHLTADIEAIRFRNVPITAIAVAPGSDYKQMAKAAYIKGSLDTENASSMNAYIVLTTPTHVSTVLKLNGSEFQGHHIRVDRTDKEVKYDHKRSIFVGNLPFDCSDEELRKVFADAVTGGNDAIESVRVVRDRLTKHCKGIAFILFKERVHAAEALGLKDKTVKGRAIRVTKCTADGSAIATGTKGKKTKAVKEGSTAPLPRFMGIKGDEKVERNNKKHHARGDKGKPKPFVKSAGAPAGKATDGERKPAEKFVAKAPKAAEGGKDTPTKPVAKASKQADGAKDAGKKPSEKPVAKAPKETAGGKDAVSKPADKPAAKPPKDAAAAKTTAPKPAEPTAKAPKEADSTAKKQKPRVKAPKKADMANKK